ncbi:reprolysin-like metallopeptidase [Flavobacterium sp. '19STA2R22 D10 B1']|uniref:zinc-dependent metalloprotease n=1 Tax=Flavobacterium aerium TaxID=3037261 RepID=UPI00278C8D2F|nr:zinc-dependent metalloprotease family protein [Flavobacterium sp. '19STA2R22 D10 B1']
MKRKLCVLLFAVLLYSSSYGQGDKLWSASNEARAAALKKIERSSSPNDYKVFKLNLESLRNQLDAAPLRSATAGTSNVVVTFPDAQGKLEEFRVVEASVMSPELQAKYPNIRSYAGQSIKNPSRTVRFSVSPEKGLSALFLGGSGTTIIDPYTVNGDNYIVFDKASTGAKHFQCNTKEEKVLHDEMERNLNNGRNADDNILRTFKLAMSVTGEYSTFHGGTLATVNAAIVATLTRVNGLYENDFNVNMVLIPTNDAVIFLNAATDPYGPNDNNYNAELQTVMTNTVGPANYDIGHLMSAYGNNGNAGCIGCVCDNTFDEDGNGKGSGFTTSTFPIGDAFDIDFVAHEMGHQFGAYHTYTFRNEGTQALLEPGSGTTIMGYAGITGPTDVQSNSDAYFHAYSIFQVSQYVKTLSCPVQTPTGNATPVVNAGADLTLPIGTAFKLTGSATDANAADVLTYCWEQMNVGGATTTYPSITATAGPNFRSFTPTTSPTRYFPNFRDVVLNGVNGNQWEKVPNITRNLAFRLTVRDNKLGGASNSSDNVVVSFSNVYGPFEVTSQNTAGISWVSGTQQTITWNVKNTTALTGSTNVNIKLSTDNGLTFPITLAANTPNDGTETITVPAQSAAQCRILIEPTGNVYYAVNSKTFSIGYTLENVCATYSNGTSTPIPDGAAGGPGPVLASTINVPDNFPISSIKVNVNVTHSYISDLNVSLIHPDGTKIRLAKSMCGSRVNFNVTFKDGAPAVVCASPTVGEYKPLMSLSALTNKPSNGNWRLEVQDIEPGDSGNLVSWNMEICHQNAAVLGTKEFELENFALYPNPNKGNFTIQFNSDAQNKINVGVYDLRGRKVLDKVYNNTGIFNENIQLDNIQSGVYMVTVQDGAKKVVKKIVIQ